MKFKSNCIIVVRSCGERTELMCKRSAENQIGETTIYTICDRPFHVTLLKSLQAGVNSGLEFLITIDSDVVLYPKRIIKVMKKLSQMDNQHLGISGSVFDRMYMRPKKRGFRIYRCQHLKKAIAAIEKSRNTDRPEANMINLLVQDGLKWMESNIIVGLHDFGQWHKDLFRKASTRAIKSKMDIDELTKKCRLLHRWSIDHRTILGGLKTGTENLKQIPNLDASEWTYHCQNFMKENGINEKQALIAEKQMDLWRYLTKTKVIYWLETMLLTLSRNFGQKW